MNPTNPTSTNPTSADPAARDPYAEPRSPTAGGVVPGGGARTSRDPAYPPPYPAGTDSRDIERDIARTRGDMDRTVDSLADRLHPKSLMGDAAYYAGLRDDDEDYYDGRARDDSSGGMAATLLKRAVKKVVYGLLDAAREHPITTAAAFGGLAFSLFERGRHAYEKSESKSKSRARRYRRGPVGGGRYAGPYAGAEAVGDYRDTSGASGFATTGVEADDYRDYDDEGRPGYRDRARAAAAGGRAKVAGAAETTRARAGAAADQARGKTQDLRDRAGAAYGSAKGRAADAGRRVNKAAGESVNKAGEVVDKAGNVLGRAVENTTDAAGNVIDAAGDVIGNVAESTRDAAGNLVDKAGNVLIAAKSGLSRGASGAAYYGREGYQSTKYYSKQGARKAEQGFETALQEYPLAVALATLAAGVVAGLAIPATRTEDEYFGDRADEVKGAASTAGREAWQRGKEVAGVTSSTAADEARRQGIDPESLAGKARHVVEDVAAETRRAAEHIVDDVKKDVGQGVEDVKRAAVSSAKDEGLTPEQLKEKGKSVVDKTKETAKSEGQHHAEATKDKAKAEADKQTP